MVLQVYEDHIHLLAVAQNHCQRKGYALKASRYHYGPEGRYCGGGLNHQQHH